MKRQDRKRSVRATVIGAVCVVAAMTLVAGAVSWVFYARIEALLVTLSEQQASTVARALRLAETANRYAAGTGAIDAARDQLQRRTATLALARHALALHEMIAALRRAPGVAADLGTVEQLVRALEETLSLHDRLAEQRIELEGRARNGRAALGRFQRAMDGFLAAAPGMEADGGRLLRRLYEAGQIDQQALLRAARADFDTTRARFAERAETIPESAPERAEAMQLLTALDRLTDGPEGAFAVREAMLDTRAEIDRQAVLTREAIAQLGAGVSRLVAAAEAEAEATKAAVGAQTDAGRRWLLLVALATFLGPVAFVWLAVGRTILAPLARLAEATRRIAAGDLHAPIPATRHREFQAIGEALAVFRDNTAALAERTEALEVSEEAHRHARERAEWALDDLRAMQQQLVESEKMAALSSLVAGVAHEINTPLGITVTSSSLLRDELRRLSAALADGNLRRADMERFLERAEEMAGLIQGNVERAAGLVQAFKQVSADQSSELRRTFDLREALEQTVVSVRPACDRAGHALALDCRAGIVVDSHPGALSQVLTILVMNSLDHAYDGRRGGHIVIAAAEDGNGMLRIDYRDDGRGIPPEMGRKVFEPFFTTRRSRGNTGLGLHIAFNIAGQTLQGRLDLVPGPGPGVHFVLRMPTQPPAATGEEKSIAFAGESN